MGVNEHKAQTRSERLIRAMDRLSSALERQEERALKAEADQAERDRLRQEAYAELNAQARQQTYYSA